MLNLLNRYERGEHEAVWRELVGLGAGALDPAHFEDTLAVARATMERARHNVELLIPRLQMLGYQFGYRWALDKDSRYQMADIAAWESAAPPRRPPPEDVAVRLRELEARAGSIPVALRAWYEVVGAVNFVGQPPKSWEDLGYQGFNGDAYKRFAREHPSYSAAEYRQFLREHPDFTRALRDEDIYLDPLYTYSVEDAIKLLIDSQEAGEEVVGEDQPKCIPLAPDHDFKYLKSGAGAYHVSAAGPTVDAKLINEWHETTFVEYLRTSFRWAGFPGLECAPRPPMRDIEMLTDGLLPL